MLRVNDVSVAYNTVSALDGVSLHVHRGEIMALIGANGAGKTTFLKTISGLLRPSQGSIVFGDRRIDSMSADRIVREGITMVPEGRKIFPDLSVWENLDLGAYTISDRKKKAEISAYVLDLFPRLKERLKQYAGTLSGGEQQMLAMGRALMGNPQLLLLDEPSMGLSPLLVERIFETIASLNRQGLSILLVEQNAHIALKVSRRAYVLETGRVTLHGESNRLMRDERIIRAYLGG